MGISLYVHVPFCTKKCSYCHFFVQKDQDHSEYLSLLEKEWSFYKDRFGPFCTLYIGGGTPSLLTPSEIAHIIHLFPLKEGAEITLEVNPETASPERLLGFYEAGVNRLSIGVQSFDDLLLQKLTRTHDAQKAIRTIEDAHRCGFNNISIDLMYDLPGQTLVSWKKSLAIATSLPLTHLSLYNLTIEPGTAFFRKPPVQPTESLSLALLEEATTYLPTQGLHRYEISAFAKKGFPSIHNSGYWTGRPFLGLGPSAFSYIDGCRFSSSGAKWAKYLRAGLKPVDFSETLPTAQRDAELTALGLRLLKGISERFLPQKLFDLHLVRRVENRIQLTEKGLLFYDAVASEII